MCQPSQAVPVPIEYKHITCFSRLVYFGGGIVMREFEALLNYTYWLPVFALTQTLCTIPKGKLIGAIMLLVGGQASALYFRVLQRLHTYPAK